VKSLGKWRTLELGLLLAFMMHLLLFLMVRSPNQDSLVGLRVPPDTRYLGTSFSKGIQVGGNARTVWSPILFSLPSNMGFSRAILEERPKLSQTLSGPQVDSEPFLDVTFASKDAGMQIFPQELMVTTESISSPPLPEVSNLEASSILAAPRVYVDPGLKDRLAGGIVLPLVLNQPTRIPWEVHADISISKDGQVRHVLLDQPLESEKLNQVVIRLLHGLHFKSADRPAEGRIEIYSLEDPALEEEVP
jgi:hypothetical protein